MIKLNTTRFLFFLLFLLAGQRSFAQRSRKDSLLQNISSAKTDTAKITALSMLAKELGKTSKDTAMLLQKQALALAENLPGEIGKKDAVLSAQGKVKKEQLVLCYYYCGSLLRLRHKHDDHLLALNYLTKSLLLCDDPSKKEQWCNIVHEFGKNYFFLDDYPKALFYEKLALQLSPFGHNKDQQANILTLSGIVCMRMGDSDQSLYFLKQARKAYIELKDTSNVANMEEDIAGIYANRGDYLLGLESMFHVLKIQERMKADGMYVTTLANIAALEINVGNNLEGLPYAYKALVISEMLHDEETEAMAINVLGTLYANLRKLSKAEDYFTWALRLNTERKNKAGLTLNYMTLGELLKKQGDSASAKSHSEAEATKIYRHAFDCSTKGLVLAREIGEKAAISMLLSNLGYMQLKLGNPNEAEKSLLESLALADSTDKPNAGEIAHENLVDLCEKKGDYKNAFEHHKRYTAIKDNLSSKDKTIEANKKTMGFEYDKKASALKAEQDKKELISQGERIRQRILIYSISSILLLVICLASFIYRNTRQKEKANLMLERKNNTIERQKKEVEDKNKNINDSINYARRIQEAILPSELFEKGETSDNFVYFAPKDIVSGDFYWRYRDGDDLFFAVVDCTGHGVPGAMMSMLGYDLLEYAVKDKGLREPGLIIQAMNEQLMQKLIKGNAGGSTDGMDMTLCKLNRKTGTLTYAGAKNELCITNNTGFNRYQVDKRSVGYEAGFAFTQQTLTLNTDETVFLYTDGYADQKGGPDNGKYMGVRFRKFLQGLSGLSCAEQKQALQSELSGWKKDFEQRDDVLVVGFKL